MTRLTSFGSITDERILGNNGWQHRSNGTIRLVFRSLEMQLSFFFFMQRNDDDDGVS